MKPASYAALERLHERVPNAAPARATMEEEFGDIGSMWLVRSPRRLQWNGTNDVFCVPADPDDGAL